MHKATTRALGTGAIEANGDRGTHWAGARGHLKDKLKNVRSSASRATARCTGGAETKMSGSIELGHRNKRHGALGGTGHLVACPLAGEAHSWLGSWLGDGASSERT
jgi:hypothetical protein